MVPLWMYLVVAAAMFCIGVYGVLARRNAVAILMSVELMLSAVNINLIAFWRYGAPTVMAGRRSRRSCSSIAAAEASVGLAIIISIYRSRHSVIVEDVNLLKG